MKIKTHTTRSEEETEKRRQHSLTFYIEDPEIKDLITAAAEKDMRNKSEWFRTYIQEPMLELAREQLAKPAVPKLKITPTTPKYVSHFERLRHEAESALQSKQVG